MPSDDPRFDTRNQGPRASGPPPVSRAVSTTEPTKTVATYEAFTQAFRRDSPDMRAVRAMLGDDAATERFLGVVFSLIAKESDILRDATPQSLVQAVKDIASLGLEYGNGETAIVVYDHVATVMVEWRGQLRQIRNSGLVRNVDTQLVYDRDGWEHGWDRNGGWFKHTPFQPERDGAGKLEDRGGIRLVYAYAIMHDGFCMLEVMTEAEINAIRDKYSRAAASGGRRVNAWRDAYGEMGRKTVIRRLRKRLPTSPTEQLMRRLEAVEDTYETPAPVDTSAARSLALSAVGASVAEPATDGARPDDAADPTP